MQVPGVLAHWPGALARGTAAINASITQLDAARDTLRVNSTALSNKLSTVTIRQDFTDKMINTLEDGAANLTNADLNEEGANLLMLQTRQSLGYHITEHGLPGRPVGSEIVLTEGDKTPTANL
jgi:flagellin-like hook-associated protein FlgL